MNLLERVLTLLRANLNSVVEKADDPEKMLRQLQLDMRNQLVQVKTQVAMAIAESHKQQKRCKERMLEAEAWLKKAEQAIQQGNDNTARTALGHYNDALKQVEYYKQQQKEQDQLVATMRTILRQLEAKISEVDTTIDMLVTRKRNALIQQRVFDALNNTGKQRDKENTARAQDAVMEAEARARALAELHQRDIDTQLAQLSAEQRIEQQLQTLKEKQRLSSAVPLLSEARTSPPPLLEPPSRLDEPAKRRIRNKSERPQQSAQSANGAETLQDDELLRLRKLLEARQDIP